MLGSYDTLPLFLVHIRVKLRLVKCCKRLLCGLEPEIHRSRLLIIHGHAKGRALESTSLVGLGAEGLTRVELLLRGLIEEICCWLLLKALCFTLKASHKEVDFIFIYDCRLLCFRCTICSYLFLLFHFLSQVCLDLLHLPGCILCAGSDAESHHIVIMLAGMLINVIS